MNKTVQRLLVFFVGIPLILGIVILKTYNYLALNLTLMAVSVLSSIELSHIFREKGIRLCTPFLSILSFLIPLAAYLLTTFEKHIDYASLVFFVCCMLIMAREVLFSKDFAFSLVSISSSIFIIFYCGFFCTFITRMTLLTHPTIKIILFLCIVFFNDSLAWASGMLLGGNNRGILKVSPNKSVAGYIGGIIGGVGITLIITLIFRDTFSGSIFKAILLSFLCVLTGDFGDLVESVFKRSAIIKDSGKIIPGRGGILDSIDSVFFTAPVFYVLTHFLY